jgi:hypothetical protein
MNINNTELENIRHNVDEQTADEIGLSASSCCRPVSSAIDVPFLISQVLRECEKGDLADFSILSCLDSEPDSKVLVEKLIASRLSFLKNQKGIQSVQDELMSFVEKLQETLSSDPSIIGVNFRDNVKGQTTAKPLSAPLCSLVRFLGFGRSNNKRVSEVIYRPEEDITVWELSKIVPCFTDRHLGYLKSFPDSVLRHFEIEGNKLSEERIQQLIKEGRI